MKNEYEEYEDELDMYYMKYLAATNRAEKLINGPGGIMEMKQTIADKEAEIQELQKMLDLVYAHDSDLLDHLKGWK
jgi:hypothetical protein